MAGLPTFSRWAVFHFNPVFVPHFSVHVSVSKYLGCFHALVVVNNAAMDMGVQISFPGSDNFLQTCTQLWHCWITGQLCFFTFLGIPRTVFHSGKPQCGFMALWCWVAHILSLCFVPSPVSWVDARSWSTSKRIERIPWTEEPGRIHSIGSHRVWHKWSNLACMHAQWILALFPYQVYKAENVTPMIIRQNQKIYHTSLFLNPSESWGHRGTN